MNREKFENLPFREAIRPKRSWKNRRWSTTPHGIVTDYLYKNLGKDAETISTQFKKRHPTLIHLLVKQIYNTSFGYEFRFRLVDGKLEETLKWIRKPNLTFTSLDYEVIYFNETGQEVVEHPWKRLWHLKKVSGYKKNTVFYTLEEVTPKVISGFSKTFSSRRELEFVKLRRKQEQFYRTISRKNKAEKRLKEIEGAINALTLHNQLKNLKDEKASSYSKTSNFPKSIGV